MDKAMARSGQLIDRGAHAYASRFGVEELNAGTEFYRPPVGHKLLSSTATLADILNGAYSAPEPERMQTARALVEILSARSAAICSSMREIAQGGADCPL